MMPYDIIIAQDEWDRFWSYVDECPWEVAAFGYIKPDEELNALYVSELFLVPQKVHGTEVDFTSEGLPYAVEKAMKEGRIEELRFCIHSHVNMGTGFSNTDDEMIEKMGQYGAPWFASAIFNKKGDTNGRVDLFAPMLELPGVKHFEVKANVLTESTRIINDQAKVDLARFVTKVDPQYSQQQWTQPTKDTAGQSPAGKAQTAIPGPKPGEDWFEDDELERELELWITARKNEWIEVEDTEGMMHFYDDSGHWKGSCHALDEDAVDWFLARRELSDSSDEDDAWHLIDALEEAERKDDTFIPGTPDSPSRENTP